MAHYRIRIMCSRLPLPVSMFVHLYVLTENHGEKTRYEVLHKKYRRGEGRGYMRINHFSHEDGLGLVYVPWVDHISAWKSRCLYEASGDADSLAHTMVTFLENRLYEYPYVEQYWMLPGPNSNTFVPWFLSHFPTVEINLPPWAYGKDYKG